MPNAEVDEAEIAKQVLDGGLEPETLARRLGHFAAVLNLDNSYVKKAVIDFNN